MSSMSLSLQRHTSVSEELSRDSWIKVMQKPPGTSSLKEEYLALPPWSINQSIQFYIALLYIPEVALQSPESSSHTHTVIPVVVSYLSSHSCPGADWQKRGCQSAPTAPPTTTNIHSYSYDAMHVFMMVGETGVPGVNPRRHGENMQTPHRKDLERPGRTGMRTQGLLAVRRQC